MQTPDPKRFEKVMREQFPLFPLKQVPHRAGDGGEVVYVSAGTQHMWNGWKLALTWAEPDGDAWAEAEAQRQRRERS